MLRRRLLTRVGILIGAFVIGAIVAVSMLQGVLADIDAANSDAALLIDGVQNATSDAIAIERTAAAAPVTPQMLASIHALTAALESTLQQLGKHPAASDPSSDAGKALAHAQALSTALSTRLPDGAMAASLHAALSELSKHLRGHVAQKQRAVGESFRRMVLGLTVAAMVIMNVSVLVLLYTAQMVLRPVGQLVEGSRMLAAERFDHRVNVDEQDEFGELARAYNYLASQLQASEEHKAEALRQLAVTLNHGLNNAMSIIELQLGLLDRQSGGNPAQAAHLRQIRSSLGHMTDIVASLKQIRRVVLTDYLPGQKMVDLERSVGADPAAAPTGQAGQHS